MAHPTTMQAQNPTLTETDGRSYRGLLAKHDKSQLRSTRGLDQGKSRGSRVTTDQGMDRSPSGSRSLDAMMKSVMKQPRITKTIACTPDVDKGQIISQLSQVKEDTAINDVIIEKLLSSSKDPSKLISKAEKAIVDAVDRKWYQIAFKDSISFTREAFGKWQHQKGNMMVSFEKRGINKEESALRGVVCWQANITLPEGTTTEDVSQVLKLFKDDRSVLDVKLSIPRAKDLIPMVDWDNARQPKLKQPLLLLVECGWSKKGSNSGSYKKLLIACLTLLKNAKRQHAEGASGLVIERSLSSKGSFRNSGRSSSQWMEPAEYQATKEKRPKDIDTRSFGRAALQKEEAQRGGTTIPVESNPSSSKGDVDQASAAEVAHPSKRISPTATSAKKGGIATKSGDHLVQQHQQQKQKEPSPKCPWRTAVDPTTNGIYYFHRTTREVCWDKPLEMVDWETKNVKSGNRTVSAN